MRFVCCLVDLFVCGVCCMLLFDCWWAFVFYCLLCARGCCMNAGGLVGVDYVFVCACLFCYGGGWIAFGLITIWLRFPWFGFANCWVVW